MQVHETSLMVKETWVSMCVSASCRLEEETVGCFVPLPWLHQHWHKGMLTKIYHTTHRTNKVFFILDFPVSLSEYLPVCLSICLHCISHLSSVHLVSELAVFSPHCESESDFSILVESKILIRWVTKTQFGWSCAERYRCYYKPPDIIKNQNKGFLITLARLSVAAADDLMLYASRSMSKRLIGVTSRWLVFVSLKLNQGKYTPVVITERLRVCLGLRGFICVSICSSVFPCVFVYLYVSMWVLRWMSACEFETLSVVLWANVWGFMVCSAVQHVWLSQKDSKQHLVNKARLCLCVRVCVCVCVCMCVCMCSSWTCGMSCTWDYFSSRVTQNEMV